MGWLGELHPQVADAIGLRARAYVAEIDLESLFGLGRREADTPRSPVSRTSSGIWLFSYPGTWRRPLLRRRIRREGGSVSARCASSSTSTKEGRTGRLPQPGYTMTYRADDRTLTDEEIAEAVRRIEEALAREQEQLR